MFKSLKIENFRSFELLNVQGLKRLNIVTGSNGAGKTSILEAIFLAAGANKSNLALSLYNFRGESIISPEIDRPFRGLFLDLNIDNPARITAEEVKPGPGGRTRRTLTIRAVESQSQDSPSVSTISGVTFNFEGPHGRAIGKTHWDTILRTSSAGDTGTVRAAAEQQFRLINETPPTNDFISAQFVGSYARSLWEQAYSTLVDAIKTKKIENLISRLRIIDPRIQNITPLTEGNAPVIYVDIGKSTLLPAGLLGSGFASVLQLTLPALVQSKSLLLIDEIEDGLHYSVVDPLIRSLISLCIENDIQMFCTTHSDEILERFASITAEQKISDIALFRLEKIDSKIAVQRYDSKEFLASREIRAEVR